MVEDIPIDLKKYFIELYDKGDYKRIIEESYDIYEKSPGNIFLLNLLSSSFFNMGNILSQTDKKQEAVHYYTQAIKINPNCTDCYYNLAFVLESENMIEESIGIYEKIIDLDPNYVDAYNSLGLILKNKGKVDIALEYFNRAITIDPNYINGYNNLANTLRQMGNKKEAIGYYEKILNRAPDYAECYFNLANTLLDMNDEEGAIGAYLQYIKFNPNNPEVFFHMGRAYSYMGEKGKAVEAYEKAIFLNNGFAKAHRELSLIKKFTVEDWQIKMIQDFIGKGSELDDIHYNFTLAKYYEDINEYKESFYFLKKGNDLKSKNSNYTIDSYIDFFKKVKKLFSESSKLKETTLNMGKDNRYKDLIFIVGMPRSGTSLTEQILASHSEVYGAGELSFMAEEVSDYILKEDSLNRVGLEKIYKGYLDKISELNIDSKVVVDKMPHNFISIGFILSSFPNAKIINMNRDPVAVCWSIYKNFFPSSEGLDYSYSLKDLAEFYRFYLDCIFYWESVFPGKIFNLQYENLTLDQESETRKLLKFCELDWEEGCMEFYKTNRGVSTASSQQVKKKIYKGSSEAWKKFKMDLEPLIEHLKQNRIIDTKEEYV